MNCVELEQSLAEVDDGSSPEQSAHLGTCRSCATLLAELNRIVARAGELQSADEPSPRVWNSIEIALRQEGLIRPQKPSSVVPSRAARWGGARWLVPLAAVLLIAVGISERKRTQAVREASGTPVEIAPVGVKSAANSSSGVGLNDHGLNDQDLIQEVAANSPAMQSQYVENLQRVNQYIQDEEALAKANPSDSETQRSLMDAYQQKSMLFEMAMDRTLP